MNWTETASLLLFKRFSFELSTEIQSKPLIQTIRPDHTVQNSYYPYYPSRKCGVNRPLYTFKIELLACSLDLFITTQLGQLGLMHGHRSICIKIHVHLINTNFKVLNENLNVYRPVLTGHQTDPNFLGDGVLFYTNLGQLRIICSEDDQSHKIRLNPGPGVILFLG